MIDMSDIRDDGVTKDSAPGFDDLDDLETTLNGMARRYVRQGQLGQSGRILLLCEAAGMVPQLARVAHEFGVDVQSAGGYDSVTAKYELARQIVRIDKPVTILHIGDLDPSGEDMFTVISEDVGRFTEQICERMDVAYDFEAVRIAVTRDHVARFELPTAPKKETDSRSRKFVGDTVQCEAIPPDALGQIVRDEIMHRLNMQAFAANLAQEKYERQIIDAAMAQLSFMEKS